MNNRYRDEIQQTLTAIDCLTVYRRVFEGGALSQLREVLRFTLDGDRAAVEKCFSFIGDLLDLSHNGALEDIDLYKNHLLDRLLEDENVFSLKSEQVEPGPVNGFLLEAVKNDLGLLKKAYDFNLLRLMDCLDEEHGLAGFRPCFENLNGNSIPATAHPQFYFHKRKQAKERLADGADWTACLGHLRGYYREVGSGIFGRYWAFKWYEYGMEGALAGVANPDPIRLEDLVGYEDQKKEILRNTGQFVRGYGANNMLLYGDRGTGKSSTIKSLVHIFGPEGLRVVEVSRHDLLGLHRIIRAIEGRAQKFILFIDDLSFEENETEYKDLKALLEGSIQKPPGNVLVYATSNRRNLIREYFSERVADEVGKQDTCQEKLSLADRFGIKLVYSTPDQKKYLQTVKELAQKSGVDLDEVKLCDLALKWALWQNSRSGRTARQFVNDLKGRLALSDLTEQEFL